LITPKLRELPPPPAGRTGWPWTEESSPVAGTEWPRISVVVPSYQQGQFLEETLRSVLLQGYADLELFVMDGGSRDQSIDVIRRYERFLAGWVSERDAGQSAAINAGWRRSRGKLMTWLNSDDVLWPGWAAAAATAFRDDSALDIVYCDVQMIDRDSRPLWVFEGRQPSIERLMLKWQAPFAQQGFLMRREAFERCGFLDEAMHFTMDAEYWLRLMTARAKFLHLSQTLAASRLHDAAKTATQRHVLLADLLRLTDDFCRTAPPDWAPLVERVRRRKYWNAANVAYAGDERKAAARFALRHLKDSGIGAAPRVGAMVALAASGSWGHRALDSWRRLRNRLGGSRE
jgi:glycosyltransferase involved in cell wall biosynthesis